MSASPYSIVMAMIWFTLASMIGHFILRRAEKCGLAFIGMIFLLTTIRIFAPLDIAGSIIIRSQVIYPTVQNWMRYPIAGSVTVGGCLILLWIAGAAFQFVGLLLDWKRQRKFRNKAMLQEGNGRLDMLFQKVADEFGHHGPFCLAVGENVTSVYQAGFLHPYILLPAQIELFSDEDICNMFRHELCHFLSRDLWIKAGFQVIGCVLWWNPVMPLLKRSVEQLLELRCDRKVCRQLSEEKQLSYMTTLSALVKHGSASVAQVYMGYLGQDNDTDIMQRFRMLLLGKPNSSIKLCIYQCGHIHKAKGADFFLGEKVYANQRISALHPPSAGTDGIFSAGACPGELHFRGPGIGVPAHLPGGGPAGQLVPDHWHRGAPDPGGPGHGGRGGGAPGPERGGGPGGAAAVCLRPYRSFCPCS